MQTVSRTSDLVGRRTLLRLAIGGAASLATASLIGACSAPASPAASPTQPPPAPTQPPAAPTAPPATGPTSAPAAVPTQAGAAAPTGAANADGVIPSPGPDVPEAYLKLPPVFQSVNAVPGRGTKVTAAFISYNPPVPPRDQNLYWQELEKRLGTTYEPTIIPADAYREKMAALVAGGDLPDLTGIEQLNAPDLLKTVNQGAFTDLTPYLDGDALQTYPNLAKIPDYGWKNVRVKKKIYGVPIVRFIPDRALYFHDDWLQTFGGVKPKNADEFLNLMVRFTKEDPAGHGKPDSFGLGGWGGLWYAFPFFTMMFRVPHQWRLNGDGSLTSAVETPEYRQAIEYMKRLYDAGVYHPDSASMTTQQAKDAFLAGKFGGYCDGWNGVQMMRFNFRQIDPNNPAASILVPPGFDGGDPAVERSQGFFG
ncbi:MAG: extracellular solute-binding protein, partial [Chloroflexi bacterium]|nr:extracellular solute-binding protein [Chloroflexota bacterium]